MLSVSSQAGHMRSSLSWLDQLITSSTSVRLRGSDTLDECHLYQLQDRGDCGFPLISAYLCSSGFPCAITKFSPFDQAAIHLITNKITSARHAPASEKLCR